MCDSKGNDPDSIINRLEDSKTLRNRASGSAEEFQKLAVMVSSGALGVFFIAVTMKIEPALSATEKLLLITAMIAMALSPIRIRGESYNILSFFI